MKYNLITILGPTAVGKTKLAVQLAYKFNGEIISADSRQVYIGMDIGTGKDLADYFIDDFQIPYHLIDIISPKEEFDLYKFTNHFHKAYNEIKRNKKIPFMVGGTGLYLNSILSNYNLTDVDFNSLRAKELSKLDNDSLRKILAKAKRELHNTTDTIEKERIIRAILIEEAKTQKTNPSNKTHSLVIGVYLDRDEIKERITVRLKERLKYGMIEEVEELLKQGVSHEKLGFFGLEYKYVSLFLQNKLNYNDMYQKLNSAIHNFAKRQMTWFRKIEKEGIKIHWLKGADFNQAKELIEREYLGKC